MVDQAYVRRVRAVIRQHGFFIQGVGPSHPTDPTYWYTVGLQRLRVPRPEVIVFGLEQGCAVTLLRAVYERVRVDGPLRAGEQITGLFSGDRRPVRVDVVRHEWIETYAGLVEPVLNRRAADVPMLQLVLADRHGRWPEDPGVDPTLAAAQPLLACDPCWQAPIVHSAEWDLFLTDQPGSVTVAVPVYGPHARDGRYELLRAEPVTADTVRLLDVSWAADHVASGDVLQTTRAEGVPGVGRDTRLMRSVLVTGPWQTRAFGLPPADGPGVAELSAALWALVDAGRTRASTTCATLHVNTVDPAGFDEAVRPFVRDGLLAPTGLQSELDHFSPPEESCPACQALRAH